VKFTSPIFSTASGSIAGITFSHNRYGLYTRARTLPVDPSSTRQQTIRALFASLVNSWLDILTAAQRTAWNTWAANTTIIGKDGMPVNITGQNAYIRFNTARLQAGGARVDPGPTIFNNGAPVTEFQLIVDGDSNVLGTDMAGTALSVKALVQGGASDDGDIAFFMAAPINVDRTFFKGPYQLAAVEEIADGIGFADFTTLFTALLSDNGDPVAGELRGMRARTIYDDGRLSEPFAILGVVTAESV
jgi:hypothetical protein